MVQQNKSDQISEAQI